MRALTVAAVMLSLCFLSANARFNDLELDPNGYVLYCPCMGRFGNQADHFLGALSFAHGYNRTLVLPPWVEYRRGQHKSVQVPFDTYFKVEPLLDYHRVMTMERFMKHLAPEIWPPSKRISYCYGARRGAESETCNAKEGNPFGPFWDTFNIDFEDSLFFGPLHYDTHDQRNLQGWKEKFPVEDHYVMAFTGAPASFPVRERDVSLQKYLVWSDAISKKVDEFIKRNELESPLLGLHFRHGVDWERACEHLGNGNRHLFGSAQCLGYGFEHGKLTSDLCLPPRDLVLKQIRKMVKKTKPNSIFIATDADTLMADIKKIAKKAKIATYEPSDPHMDLAILARADYHIGNCISTFSAFAVRERRANNKPVSFWGFHGDSNNEKHIEL